MRESTFRKRLGVNLKRLREQRALTQRELAEASQIAEKYLSRIEIGLATPSVHVAWRLAQALGSTLDRLLGLSAREDGDLAAITRLLRGKTRRELKRALRVIIALCSEDD